MTEKRILFRRNDNRSIIELQFWLRFFAFTIDGIILKLLVIPFVIFGLGHLLNLFSISVLDYIEPSNINDMIPLWIAIYFVIYGFYSAIFESSKMQATIGKWFLRYKVYDTNANKISFLRALLRFSLKIFSICTILGVWIIDMNEKRQGLHDLICNTIVRKK